MKAALAIVLAAALAGCSTTVPGPALEPLKPRMPAAVRAPCDPVPPAPKRGSTMGDLYTFAGAMIDLYADCAMRDRAKAQWVESQGF